MNNLINKKKKWSIILLVVAALFMTAGYFTDASLFFWARSLWWHSRENHVVVFKGIRLDLPLRWFVLNNYGEDIRLVAAPDYRKGSGAVFVVENESFKNYYPFADLSSWPNKVTCINGVDVYY